MYEDHNNTTITKNTFFMTDKKEFIPALGYDWLTGFYDLAIKLTMPEKKSGTS